MVRHHRHFVVMYILISSFNAVGLLFFWTDISSATDAMCVLQPTCFPSSCQRTDPITVDPDSSITLNCSIITAGLELGMTWRQAKTRIHNNTGSPDLVLLQFNSTKFSGTIQCDCTNIHFTRRCFLAYFYLSLQKAWSSATKEIPLFTFSPDPKWKFPLL